VRIGDLLCPLGARQVRAKHYHIEKALQAI